MKNILKLIGTIALVAVIGFSMACGDNDGGITTIPVTGVTLNKSSISLKVGDTETLTATVAPNNATNNAVTWSTSDAAKATVSEGVVTAVAAGTATITVTTADGGKTAQCTVTVTMSTHADDKYDTIYLKANGWDNIGRDGGAQWASDYIKLSDFTTIEPKKDDLLQIKISGVDKELKNFTIQFFQWAGDDGSTFRYLAETDRVVLSKTFNDHVINVYMEREPEPNTPIYFQLLNHLWYRDSNGEYEFDSGETIPADTPNGTVMATIKNFSISIVKVDDDEQTLITIIDIPAVFNGKYATVALAEDINNNQNIAAYNSPEMIANGKVENCEMFEFDEREKIFGKNGGYYVILRIFEQPDLNSDLIYLGVTMRKMFVIKGGNILSANDFFPDITDYTE